jgi:glucosamine--fructose-6-phosphate aminotransferase (isomerizing)
MCGIVGYIGSKDAVPFLMEGLEKLSYRGYDSSGIAILEGKDIEIHKRSGKVRVLQEEIEGKEFKATVGIAHTRWATHGGPTDLNAHPHSDCSGHVSIVHNGIIENYHPLKKRLEEKGHTFSSETDTEVIVHLIEEHYDPSTGLVQAVREALQRVIGAFALVVISDYQPDMLIVARKDCPLIIGFGQGETYVASDIPVLLSHTDRFILLENNEMAMITSQDVEVTNFFGKPIDRPAQTIKWEMGKVEKAGFDHFMLKEINEQPRCIRDMLLGRLQSDGTVSLEDIPLTDEYIESLKRIYIVACGTAFHAAMIGEHIFEDILRIPVEVDLASEFRYRDPILDETTLVIAISQSGETADTLAGVVEAKAKGAKVLSIVNVVNSSIVRESDYTLYTRAGAEIAVASTKAFTSQIIGLFLLALRFSQHCGHIAGGVLEEIAQTLQDIPAQIQSIIDDQSTVQAISKELARQDDGEDRFFYNDCFFLGRGLDHAIAREGALKLKEISYIHADAYAAGELKHGNIALITDRTPLVALLTQDRLREKMISNIKEVVARDAPVIAVAFEDDPDIESMVGKAKGFNPNIIRIPRTHKWLAPILATIPLQLIAYYTGVNRGCDVDQPRNLAKSVTVE